MTGSEAWSIIAPILLSEICRGVKRWRKDPADPGSVRFADMKVPYCAVVNVLTAFILGNGAANGAGPYSIHWRSNQAT